MAKRGDNIHKRKDGRWEGRYPKGRTDRGTIAYGSVYGKSYNETKEKLRIVVQNISIPQEVTPAEITFGYVLKEWMRNNSVRLKGGTICKYQNLIQKHILPEFENTKISEMNSTRINSFLNDKLSCSGSENALSASYVRSIMIVVNAALKYAVSENLCMPLKTPIYKPGIPKQELLIFNKEEQRRLEFFLLNNLNNTTAGIYISLHTGLRIGEICALTWDNVDLGNLVIKVRHTIARVKHMSGDISEESHLIIDSPKTKSSNRDIPISTSLLPVLKAIQNKSANKYVLSDTDTFVKPRTYEYRYHRILNKCNLPALNYHALRHTFATRCIEAGVDVKSLSEILGHANVSITLNTYVHSSMEMKRNQLEKLVNLSE